MSRGSKTGSVACFASVRDVARAGVRRRINTITPHGSRLYIRTGERPEARAHRGRPASFLRRPSAARFSFRFAARKAIRLDRRIRMGDVGGGDDRRVSVHTHARSNRGDATQPPCRSLPAPRLSAPLPFPSPRTYEMWRDKKRVLLPFGSNCAPGAPRYTYPGMHMYARGRVYATKMTGLRDTKADELRQPGRENIITVAFLRVDALDAATWALRGSLRLCETFKPPDEITADAPHRQVLCRHPRCYVV